MIGRTDVAEYRGCIRTLCVSQCRSFFFSSRRRHTRLQGDWSSDVCSSDLDMLDLFRQHRYTKDISFGVVDVHTHVVEPDSVVEERLRRGLEVLPKEAVWVDPDCGLKTRTVDEGIGQMRTVVSVARAFRH